jgi:hypothetical protein
MLNIVQVVRRFGVKRKNIRFNAIQFHLWHNENQRPTLRQNNDILNKAINTKIIWCENGINKYLT